MLVNVGHGAGGGGEWVIFVGGRLERFGRLGRSARVGRLARVVECVGIEVQ